MTEGWLILIGVAVGGGLGSVARMFLGRWHGNSVPLGILAGNTIASAIVALVATGAHDWLWAALSAGLAGGLSTFSTWAKQTADLWAESVSTAAGTAASSVAGAAATVSGVVAAAGMVGARAPARPAQAASPRSPAPWARCARR